MDEIDTEIAAARKARREHRSTPTHDPSRHEGYRLTLLQPFGPPAAVFLLVAGGVVQRCICGNVYAEYEEVIRRPRLALDEEVIAATLRRVGPTETIKASSDSGGTWGKI